MLHHILNPAFLYSFEKGEGEQLLGPPNPEGDNPESITSVFITKVTIYSTYLFNTLSEYFHLEHAYFLCLMSYQASTSSNGSSTIWLKLIMSHIPLSLHLCRVYTYWWVFWKGWWWGTLLFIGVFPCVRNYFCVSLKLYFSKTCINSGYVYIVTSCRQLIQKHVINCIKLKTVSTNFRHC